MFTATGAVDWNPGDKFTNGDEKQPRSGEAQDSRQDRPQTRQDEGSQQAREAAVGGPARPGQGQWAPALTEPRRGPAGWQGHPACGTVPWVPGSSLENSLVGGPKSVCFATCVYTRKPPPEAHSGRGFPTFSVPATGSPSRPRKAHLTAGSAYLRRTGVLASEICVPNPPAPADLSTWASCTDVPRKQSWAGGSHTAWVAGGGNTQDFDAGVSASLAWA